MHHLVLLCYLHSIGWIKSPFQWIWLENIQRWNFSKSKASFCKNSSPCPTFCKKIQLQFMSGEGQMPPWTDVNRWMALVMEQELMMHLWLTQALQNREQQRRELHFHSKYGSCLTKHRILCLLFCVWLSFTAMPGYCTEFPPSPMMHDDQIIPFAFREKKATQGRCTTLHTPLETGVSKNGDYLLQIPDLGMWLHVSSSETRTVICSGKESPKTVINAANRDSRVLQRKCVMACHCSCVIFIRLYVSITIEVWW